MTEQDVSKQLKSEIPAFRELLSQLNTNATELFHKTSDFVKKAEKEKLAYDDGVSYLEVKQQLLLSYCIDICFFLLLKVSGKSVKGHPVFDQLLELRTVLEKCRPLDKKLKYQIDKLLKVSETTKQSSNDPLSFRPNLEALVAKTGDAEEHDLEEDVQQIGKKDGVYRAPKISAMPYQEDENEEEKEEKYQKRLREKLRRSEILASLQEEYGDRPELVKGQLQAQQAGGVDSAKLQKLRKEQEERTRWEEERFVRVRMTKKDKKKQQALERQASQLNSLADIGKFASFDDFSAGRSSGRAKRNKTGFGKDGRPKTKKFKKRR